MTWQFDHATLAGDLEVLGYETVATRRADMVFVAQIRSGVRAISADELADICNQIGETPAHYYREGE